MIEWVDPDDGIVYEMYYDVPQADTPNERESVKWRIQGSSEWQTLPPFADVPDEVYEVWHGPRVR